MEVQLRKWIELIKSNQLEGLTEEIQENIAVITNEKLNKQIFKLLLYLSHTAGQCNNEKCTTGKEIYKLTCLLCSMFTEIPDEVKFVSSLYHVIRCLLAMHMYEEAAKINVYLKSKVLSDTNRYVTEIIIKITCLWQNKGASMLLNLEKDPSSSKNYWELKNIVCYELDITQIAYKNYTKPLLMKISSYLSKVASISTELNPCFVDFYHEILIRYMDQRPIFLNDDEKYVIYRYMLFIISTIVCVEIKQKRLQSTLHTFSVISNRFKKVLIEDTECHQCFQQFETLCNTLIKSFDSLENENIKNIKDNVDSYVQIARKYENTGAVRQTTLIIVEVLVALHEYWETCVESNNKYFLESNLLTEIMKLTTQISTLLVEQISDRCISCRSSECKIKGDIHNAVVIKTRCVSIVNKLAASDLTQELCVLAREFLEENVAFIYEMKLAACKCWIPLWCSNSALIYNLAISASHFYMESALLFSLLLCSLIKIEGIQIKSPYINIHNPVCTALHRLSSAHYTHGIYKEAMMASALNGFLSYNDPESKAFRMWANIKHKCSTQTPVPKEIMEMSMIACLRQDKAKIEKLGLTIELSKGHLVQLCLREIKGLQEAKVNLITAIKVVLNEMRALKATPLEYGRAVLMLACHLLNLKHDEDISSLLQQTITSFKGIKLDLPYLHLKANLQFCIFVNKLHTVNKKTITEMESIQFPLYAPRLTDSGENESPDVVPTYSTISIKEDYKLMMYFQKSLKTWDLCINILKLTFKEGNKGCDLITTLRILIVAGEYARLYRYQKCEVHIWKLAYELATLLKDHCAIIYVTARSISLRRFEHEWIAIADEHANKLKDTDDEDIIRAIAIFWISLSDFYYECDMHDEAKKLLDEARKLPKVSFFSNISVYLYSLDRTLCNYSLLNSHTGREEYTRYIVETLYSMVDLSDRISTRKWKPQDKYLFGCDVLFTTTINLSLRINSFLSFREIGGHLVRRLKTAQALGATMRVAEILRSLCFIDLSRSQLNDCEVKLQGLEHILGLEKFQSSMNTKSTKVSMENIFHSPVNIVDPIRDMPHNDTSPVLKKRIFDLPEFLHHKNCDCYACQNISYHYLVLASTHIRAQLYALQRHFSASMQYFRGAFRIKEILDKTEKQMESSIKNENQRGYTWEERYYATDCILLLLNFSNLLRSDANSRNEKLNDIILLAIRICKIYKLEGHPIYMSIKELMLETHFQQTLDSLDYSKFTVPDLSEMDTSKFEEKVPVDQKIYSTPIGVNNRTKKLRTLQRNKASPKLKLTKITMSFSDDEEDNATPRPITRRTRSRSKGMLDEKNVNDPMNSSTSARKELTRLKGKLIKKEFHTEETEDNVSLKNLIEVAPLVTDISNKFSPNINLSTKKQYARKTRSSKQQSSNDYNEKITEVSKQLKSMNLDEKKDSLNENGIESLEGIP